MLDFEAEEVTEGECLDVALLASIGPAAVVDQLATKNLVGAVFPGLAVGAADLAAVVKLCPGKVLALLDLGRAADAVEHRVEEVEDEAALGLEMPADGSEAGELVLHLDDVLEGTEGNDGESELPVEVEAADVGLDERDALLDRFRFPCKFLAKNGKHFG